nr:MAG TPA: hypothetical protein [Caudoviricetes sp.]
MQLSPTYGDIINLHSILTPLPPIYSPVLLYTCLS